MSDYDAAASSSSPSSNGGSPQQKEEIEELCRPPLFSPVIVYDDHVFRSTERQTAPDEVFRGCTRSTLKEAIYRAMNFFQDSILDSSDLASSKPDDRDTLICYIEDELPRVKSRPDVEKLISSCRLTDDDIAALMLFKLERPYPFCRMYNAWMLTDQRRDLEYVVRVGPCFKLQYYAVSKLSCCGEAGFQGSDGSGHSGSEVAI